MLQCPWILKIVAEREWIVMLFRRNIEPSCAYCGNGMSLGFKEIACSKRGIMSEEGKCTAFRYEPTKRQPEYANNIAPPKVSAEDMSI